MPFLKPGSANFHRKRKPNTVILSWGQIQKSFVFVKTKSLCNSIALQKFAKFNTHGVVVKVLRLILRDFFLLRSFSGR